MSTRLDNEEEVDHEIDTEEIKKYLHKGIALIILGISTWKAINIILADDEMRRRKRPDYFEHAGRRCNIGRLRANILPV